MPFQPPNKYDYVLIFFLIILFSYAFFCNSFYPSRDAEGNIIYTIVNGERRTLPSINMVCYIAPLFIIVELFKILVFPGKPRLREIPWKLHVYCIADKIYEGKKEYHDWRLRKSSTSR